MSDKDGDVVDLSVWQYKEPGTFPGQVDITSSGKNEFLVHVPANAERGQTIHVIVQGTDHGKPALTSYQRVIITVK